MAINKRAALKHVLAVVLTLILVFTLLFAALMIVINSEYLGFYKIEHRQVGSNSKINIYCIGHSNYSISRVSPDEEAVKGDGMFPINNDLGEHVIMVLLSDTEVADKLSEVYESWTTYKLGNSDFSFMYVSDISFHGVKIYIGSDEMIDTDTIVVKGIKG